VHVPGIDRTHGGGAWLPRSLLEEIDAELVAARRRLTFEDARVGALESLLETSRVVTRELGRPPGLPDLLATAPSAAERHQRRRLLHVLRGTPGA
jgi:hypothetical protein